MARRSCLVPLNAHPPKNDYAIKWTDRIGRRVKLRDLHIVLAVADAGSMTRAAEDLAVSYPVVSKTISELELNLGVSLFDRSISGVEPTHYGRALLKSGAAVFDEMRKGLQEIEFIRQPDAGELRIGSSIVVDAGFLPAVIERFAGARRPRFTCYLRTSRPSNTTICGSAMSSSFSAGCR
jgi:DNA-binding transcriptional LysR family regulator